MTAFWDFRKILNVNPDEDWTCVGPQCTRRITASDRYTAGRLLDQMNRLEIFQECVNHLNTLATLLLCSEGCMCHVNDISSDWKLVSEQEYRAMKRRSSNAFALEAQKELLLAAQHLKLELEAESGDRVSQLPPRRRIPQYSSSTRLSRLSLFPPEPSKKRNSRVVRTSSTPVPAKSELPFHTSKSLIQLSSHTQEESPVEEIETGHDLYHNEIRAMGRSVSCSSPLRRNTSFSKVDHHQTMDFFQFEQSLGKDLTFNVNSEDAKSSSSPVSSPVVVAGDEKLSLSPTTSVSQSISEKRPATSGPDSSSMQVVQRPKKTLSQNDIRKKENRDRASTLFKDLGMEIDKLHLMMALASIPTPSPAPELGLLYTSNPSPEELTAAANLSQEPETRTSSRNSSRNSSRPPKSRFSTKYEHPSILETAVSEIHTTTFFSSDSPQSSTSRSSGDYSTISIGYSTPRTFYDVSSDAETEAPLVLAPTIYTPPRSPPKSPPTKSSRRPKPISPPRINTSTPRPGDMPRRPSSTSIITPKKHYQPWLPHPTMKRASMAMPMRSPVVKSPFANTPPRSTPISKSLSSDRPTTNDGAETYLTDLQIWERLTKAEKPLPGLPREPVKRTTVLLPNNNKPVKRVDSGVFVGLAKGIEKSGIDHDHDHDHDCHERTVGCWGNRLKKRFGSVILGRQFRVKKNLPGWI